MKKSIIGFLILFALVFIISGMHSTSLELKMLTNLGEDINTKNMVNITKIVFTSKPNIESRQYYGEENAPIVFIAYMDFTSDTSRDFIENMLPKLKDEYVHTGKMKYYAKYYLTTRDYKIKNERFIYAQSLACTKLIKSEIYHDFYLDLFYTKPDELLQLVKKYDISKEEFIDCVNNVEFESIKSDSVEVEKFNLISYNPVFYYGVSRPTKTTVGIPNYDQLKRTLRFFQTEVGD